MKLNLCLDSGAFSLHAKHVGPQGSYAFFSTDEFEQYLVEYVAFCLDSGALEAWERGMCRRMGRCLFPQMVRDSGVVRYDYLAMPTRVSFTAKRKADSNWHFRNLAPAEQRVLNSYLHAQGTSPAKLAADPMQRFYINLTFMNGTEKQIKLRVGRDLHIYQSGSPAKGWGNHLEELRKLGVEKFNIMGSFASATRDRILPLLEPARPRL